MAARLFPSNPATQSSLSNLCCVRDADFKLMIHDASAVRDVSLFDKLLATSFAHLCKGAGIRIQARLLLQKRKASINHQHYVLVLRNRWKPSKS